MTDKDFVNGLFFKEPNQRAPDFIKGSISIKRKDLGNWLRGRDEEWINVDIKESRNGKIYCEVNNWKPEKKQEPDQEEFPDDDIPF